MPKTILHVGLHKSASTYLQRQIFPQSKHHLLLTLPYTSHNGPLQLLQYGDDTAYSKDLLQEELAKLPTDSLILSDEGLSGCPLPLHNVNRSMIARRLSEVFPDAEIVLFLRDQRDYCISHYSSYIKMPYGFNEFENFLHIRNEEYSFDQYQRNEPPRSMGSLHYDISDYYLSLDSLKYTRVIELYETLFPKCHVFLFEDLITDPVATVARLGEICGETFEHREVRENTSLSPRQIVKIRRRNLVNRVQGKVLRGILRSTYKLMPVLRAQDTRKIAAEKIGNYFTADNAALRRKLSNVDWDKHVGKYL
ncbi:hypothetical protein [Hoeflea sp.]|uniref:hypothetical protein n=1 Tax=Hoeflea sp. TaxID=1940281 RepID=UPI003B010372